MLENFRFENPEYLWWLVAVAVLALVRFITYFNQRKRLKKFGDPELLKQLMPDVSRWRPLIKFCLLELALVFIIIMLARPQEAGSISSEERKGIETVICMDVSNSMRAQDVSPDRLTRAKMLIENMIERFSNDKIGIIVFAGDAFLQMPITSDYVSAKMFLGSIDPSMIRNQGTDIAAAINMANQCFTQQEEVGKAVIVITDGEDHEGGALEAAKGAKESGRNVYVLGIGSTKGSPIPSPDGRGFMTDNHGETVMSRLNDQMCRDIAQAGGGAFIHVENNSSAQRQLEEELDKLQKGETTVYSDFEDHFQIFGIVALLLIILEICILDRKNPLLKNVKLFSKRDTMKLVIIFLISHLSFVPCQADNRQARKYIRQGNSFFRQGKQHDATVSYFKAVNADSTDARAQYNLATSMYPENWKMVQKEQQDTMVQTLLKAAELEQNPLRRSKAFHNIGTLFQNAKEFKMAIEAYKNALRSNPNDDESRYNLVLCQRQLKNDDQGQNGDNGQDNQEQDKQKQDEQQQQQQQQQQDQQQQQQQEPPMSKENAEQLLNAAMQEEKKTQEKMQQMQQGQRRQIEKNW